MGTPVRAGQEPAHDGDQDREPRQPAEHDDRLGTGPLTLHLLLRRRQCVLLLLELVPLLLEFRLHLAAKFTPRRRRVLLELRHAGPQRDDLLRVVAGAAAGSYGRGGLPQLLALELELGDPLFELGDLLRVAGALLAADPTEGAAEAGDELAHALLAGSFPQLIELLFQLGDPGIALLNVPGIPPGVDGGQLLGQALDLLALPLDHLRAGAIRRRGRDGLFLLLIPAVQRVLHLRHLLGQRGDLLVLFVGALVIIATDRGHGLELDDA